MREVSRPTIHGNWEKFNSSIPMAWKTGTSFGHRDAWAVGTTPALTIGVWVGNADGEGRDGIIGAKTAGELLFAVSDILSLQNNWWPTPPEQVMVNICSDSGELATSQCTNIEKAMVPPSSLNTEPCAYHVSYWVDNNGNRLLPECIGNSGAKKTSLFQLPPVQANYYKLHHPHYQELPIIASGCKIGDDYLQSMQFIYPANHQVILIPKGLNNDDQAIVFRVAHQNDHATLYWYMDETFIGKTVDKHRISAKPSDGPHKIYVVDETGNTISQTFEIAHNSLAAIIAN
jgi:penicillin-binding protein 1C